MKYLYCVVDTKTEDLEKNLLFSGSYGWELVQIFPVNEVTSISLGSKPIMKTYLRCVFKKPDPDA
jgi:hypothetical protein